MPSSVFCVALLVAARGHPAGSASSSIGAARPGPRAPSTAAAAVAGATVNVVDFGADPHSHNDSTAAFNAAFKAAQLIGNSLASSHAPPLDTTQRRQACRPMQAPLQRKMTLFRGCS